MSVLAKKQPSGADAAAGTSAAAGLPWGDPRFRRQQWIAEVARRIAAENDPARMMRLAAALSAEALEAQFCGVAMVLDNERCSFWAASTDAILQGASGNPVELSHVPTHSFMEFTIQKGTVVSTSDLSAEERFTDDLLTKRGIRSGIASPVGGGRAAIGGLGIFYSQPRNFAEEDLVIVDAVAQLLAASVARCRAEEALARARRERQSLLEDVDALVLELSFDNRILSMNRAGERITGFSASEIEGRTFWNALVAPEQVGLVQQAFDRLRGGEPRVDFENLILTADGERRSIRWSLATLPSHGNRAGKIIATGTDVTDRQMLQSQLAVARDAAQEAQRRIDTLVEQVAADQPLGAFAGQSGTSEPISGGRGAERRRGTRWNFQYVQMIAPVVDGRLPQRDAFQPVVCRDISVSGFSFFQDAPPENKQLVVAFGIPPKLLYLASEIVRVTCRDTADGPVYVVGCAYTGRIGGALDGAG